MITACKKDEDVPAPKEPEITVEVTTATEKKGSVVDYGPWLVFTISNTTDPMITESRAVTTTTEIVTTVTTITTIDGVVTEVSQDKTSYVVESITETREVENPNYEAPPEYYGNVVEGIYLEKPDYGHQFIQHGTGSAWVVLSDAFGEWVDDVYDFTVEAHGDRVVETFKKYATEGTYSLFTFDGSERSSIDAIHTDKTVIISASVNASAAEDALDYANKLTQTKALLLHSLENIGEDGPTPHGPLAYKIAETTIGLDQTLFIGWSSFVDGSWDAGADLEGDFVKNNLDNVVFVQMPNWKEADSSVRSTSHATPRIAAVAAKILSENPTMTPQELKQALLAKTITKEANMADDATHSTKMTVKILPFED